MRVFPIAAATRGSKGEAINDYAALKSAGAVAVTDDGHPILKDSIMRETLAAAARVGLSVIQHAEDTRLTQGASMNLGPISFKLGLRGMPPEAESGMVERDIRLVTELRDARAHLHVAHTSTAAALAAVRQARRNGLRVTCEVAPHHFLLTEEHVGLYNTNAKMNPPLRSAADRDAMIEAILDGVVDAIATDHAPHAMHEKEVEFENAPNGITGLETALGLCLRWLHKEWKMPLGRVLSLLSAQPAALLDLKGRGTLAVGSFADVVVFDPKAEWTYRAREDQIEVPQHPLRRLDHAGQGPLDDQRRPHRPHGLVIYDGTVDEPELRGFAQNSALHGTNPLHDARAAALAPPSTDEQAWRLLRAKPRSGSLWASPLSGWSSSSASSRSQALPPGRPSYVSA